MFLLNIIFSLVNIIMKIAVVGIGVAGAYLMNRLSDDPDNHVVGFERMPKAQHDAVCAWATCQNVMSGLAKNCGLNFDQYILHDGKYMKVDLKETNGTRDKINSRHDKGYKSRIWQSAKERES
jgi:choline dehydrogenase-like flavoprotein